MTPFLAGFMNELVKVADSAPGEGGRWAAASNTLRQTDPAMSSIGAGSQGFHLPKPAPAGGAAPGGPPPAAKPATQGAGQAAGAGAAAAGNKWTGASNALSQGGFHQNFGTMKMPTAKPAAPSGAGAGTATASAGAPPKG